VRCLRTDELNLPGIQESVPRLAATDQVPAGTREVLAIKNLWLRYFRAQPRTEWAVQDVTLNVNDGETFGLVGESGSGKTSVARVIAGLVPPIEGQVLLDGKVLPPNAKKRNSRDLRRIQYVFQNSSLALNPRQTVSEILDRPLKAFFNLSWSERHKRILELMDLVRLSSKLFSAAPGTLSGGEQQRVAIARALAAEPQIMICDEIVSALDVSVQAAIVDLLAQLQSQMGLSYLFISHDLAVVRSIAHRIGVMHKGRLVELGQSESVFQNPTHEYTRSLLAHTSGNLALAHDIVAA
jgi:peptide/nickel transport system ATP-binding protein